MASSYIQQFEEKKWRYKLKEVTETWMQNYLRGEYCAMPHVINITINNR